MESSKTKYWLVLCLLAAAAIGYYLFASREGVEARKASTQAVHDTAEQATGLGAVKVGEELKGALRGVDHEREEQFKTVEK